MSTLTLLVRHVRTRNTLRLPPAPRIEAAAGPRVESRLQLGHLLLHSAETLLLFGVLALAFL